AGSPPPTRFPYTTLFRSRKGENPNYPDGIEDNTHFSPFGAEQMARAAADGIRESGIDLAKYLVKDDGEDFHSRLLPAPMNGGFRSEEHTSELQLLAYLVC